MRFVIPADLLQALIARRSARRHRDEIEDRFDAFILDGGLGPPSYLARDGRILIDEGWWFEAGAPLREANEHEAITSIVAGAKKTGLSGLLELLPERPKEAIDCKKCGGTRWVVLEGFKQIAPSSDEPARIVCFECHGRGWFAVR